MYICKQCLDYLNSRGDHGFSRRLSWDDDVETTIGNWSDDDSNAFIPDPNGNDDAIQCEWCGDWRDVDDDMYETRED